MTDSREKLDSGDELDFDEFLENITDKFDSITQQIEDQKQVSRQQWQRTRNEINEQKRLLKSRLEKRIQRVSEKFKKPTFIRMRDKIAFTIGVANTCFSPLIAGRWPHILPLVYTVQALCLISLRFFIYKRKHWHYFVYDLCYFINVLTLIYLWIFPESKILFTVCYTLCHGPLAFAVVLWRNSLVFHSFDKMTSIFIHMYPLLTMFTIRWLLPIELQQEYYPAITNIGPILPTRTSIFYSVLFYLVWQILYYVFIVYGRREKVQSGSRVTSYTWLLTDKNGFVAHLIEKLGMGGPDAGLSIYKVLFFFLLQFGYMFLSILPVSLVYYRYKYANVIFICFVFMVSIFNGGSFYIDVFSHQYVKSFQVLQGVESPSTNNPSENTSQTEDKKES